MCKLGMHGKRPGSPKKCTGTNRFCVKVLQAAVSSPLPGRQGTPSC